MKSIEAPSRHTEQGALQRHPDPLVSSHRLLIHCLENNKPMKHKIFLPSIFCLALLQACGGGGESNAQVNAAVVSKPFVTGNAPRYQLLSAKNHSLESLSRFVQASSGAVTTLGNTSLSGDIVVKETVGDETFALGRWYAGTVTRPSGAETLKGVDGNSYHYIVVNTPAAFPTAASMRCDSGLFTTPTIASGDKQPDIGRAAGSLQLSFGADGAKVSGLISIDTLLSSGTLSLNGTVATPAGQATTGSLLDETTGSVMQIGDGGNGGYAVAISYSAKVSTGARYIGVARFRCST